MLESLCMRSRKVYVPNEDKASPGFKEQCAGQYDPVHQPWFQQCGIGGLESLVGSEHGEEEGRDRSARLSVMRSYSDLSG